MRRFELVRHEDVTGVSGTGVVAEGVEFGDGSCVMRWLGQYPSRVDHASVANLVAVHGHGGLTEVRWVDQYHPLPKPKGKRP